MSPKLQGRSGGLQEKDIWDAWMRAHPFSRTLTEIRNAPAPHREAASGDREVSGRRLFGMDGPGTTAKLGRFSVKITSESARLVQGQGGHGATTQVG